MLWTATRAWSSLRPSSASIGLTECRFSPTHASAIPIGSRTAVRMRRSLAAVGSRSNRSAAVNSPHPRLPRDAGLAELAQQVEEIVGNGFAQRIVIDRAERAPEVARPRLAAAAIRSCGLLRAPGISGSLRVASLPGTQLLVPPRAGPRALIIISFEGATGRCAILPIRSGPARCAAMICCAASPARWGKPNGRSFVPALHQYLGGERGPGVRTVLPGLQQISRAAKDGANSSFEGEYPHMSLGQELAPHLPFLRRYARALTGSQAHGDAFVRATLEAIVAKPDEFPRDVDPRLGLYRTFHAIWSTANIEEGEEPSQGPTGAEGIAQARLVADHASVAAGAAADLARGIFVRGHGLSDRRRSAGRRQSSSPRRSRRSSGRRSPTC